MSWSIEALSLLDGFAARASLPRVVALHVPPTPPPGGLRGEFCALELEDGSLGLSYVLLGDTLATLQAARLDLHGADPLALAHEVGSGSTLRRTVAFAAVNALTRCLFARTGFVPPKSRDSLGGLDPQPGETVGMVGYFTPLVKRIVERGAKLRIVELREDLVRDDGTVRITTDARELAGLQQVLATGTLMLNDSLERMLAHCHGARHLALIGPSVGAPPDPLFARGVTLLGGTWVHETRGFVDALVRGEPTGAFADKSALRPADYPGWPALLSRL
jgi:uncharacterized protein (DUF4213/DUF364 family)